MNSHLEFPMQSKGVWLDDALAYFERGSIRAALSLAMKSVVDNWIDRLILLGVGMATGVLVGMAAAILFT